MSPIDKLFSELKTLETYPPGVCGSSDRIEGTAFFPGGEGLFMGNDSKEETTIPTGKVMVLGHNFGTMADLRKAICQGSEDIKRVPTWRNLLSFLNEVGILPYDCFFTNVFMGFIDVNEDNLKRSNTGKFPGAKDPEFISQCLNFFETQLKIMRPSLILTLGAHVPPLIAEASDDLADWRSLKSLPSVDKIRMTQVNFSSLDDIFCTIIALTHPSLRPVNIKKQPERVLAEINMVKESWNEATSAKHVTNPLDN